MIEFLDTFVSIGISFEFQVEIGFSGEMRLNQSHANVNHMRTQQNLLPHHATSDHIMSCKCEP